MRLSLPTLSSISRIPLEPTDFGFQALKEDALKTDFIDMESESCLGLNSLLKLPQTFGSIFLGETFRAYLTIHNLLVEGNVYQIVLNIYIQTGTQKINLFTPDSITYINANDNFDHIITHEVKDLVCEVSYHLEDNKDSQPLHFRKFFKFQVNKPLDVKTKFYNSETGEVFLETQVQNLTSHPIVLEHMTLYPHPNYNVSDVNYNDQKKLIFNEINCLNPTDIRQYLFCLYLKDKMIKDKHTLTLTDVGKLHISWRGPYGEKGALQTSQLHRLPSQIPDILLQVETIPDQIELEKPFVVSCRITNFSDRTMDLGLALIDDFNIPQNVYWLGTTRKHLGKLEPDQFNTLQLCLYATHTGFKSISGVRLIDTFLNRTYDYDNIGQVYVFNPTIIQQ